MSEDSALGYNHTHRHVYAHDDRRNQHDRHTEQQSLRPGYSASNHPFEHLDTTHVSSFPQLLKESNLYASHNQAVRIEAFRHAQQLFGNRAVQRYVHRSATIPVQRRNSIALDYQEEKTDSLKQQPQNSMTLTLPNLEFQRPFHMKTEKQADKVKEKEADKIECGGLQCPDPKKLGLMPRNPGIASGSECRGACGSDCPSTCEAKTYSHCVSDKSGECHGTCTYNYLECGSHAGCRMHDNCYDRCAENGETELGQPCHLKCDAQCASMYPTPFFLSWLGGGGPYDSKLKFLTSESHDKPSPGKCSSGHGGGGKW